MALVAAVAVGAVWVTAQAAALRDVAQSVERADAAGLASRVDSTAVQAGLRDMLGRIAAEAPGEEAASFLGAMVDDMAQAWAVPAALTEVARVRGIAPGAAVEAVRALRPVGLSAVELPLATTAGAATPMTLRLEMRDAGVAPRWQVTGVTLDATARPAAAPAPMRLGALR
jgi:hypothetical protein